MKVFTTCVLALGSVTAAPVEETVTKRSGPIVALDYATYQGYFNTTSGLNTFRGIRFAAPPTGNLRWRAPQSPAKTSGVIQANEFAPMCPQTFPSLGFPIPVQVMPGNEDCLFLNVVAPPVPSGTKLPVFVWIHGGGYGLGDGMQNLNALINANGNKFIGVAIQYRLGAFGFLSSDEIKGNGTPNAGLLDVAFALKWIQNNIAKFGGDATKVTITGESAGAGAVMLMATSNNGELGTSLFQNGIAASPYLPAQYDYNGAIPQRLYYQFASRAGCGSSGAVLACLRSKDTQTLQQVNADIAQTVPYGTWPFVPVTDTPFFPLTSMALTHKRVNGKNMLVGNNANEGPLFVPTLPAPIKTVDQLKAWLHTAFPTLINPSDIQAILDANPISNTPVDDNAPKYETNGRTGATAIEVSQVATGQAQRANNIYAEATFNCPSYWLNEAYVGKGGSYHYQYSVPFAAHGADVTGYFGPTGENQGTAFNQAFREIWGKFILSGNPSIASTNFPTWQDGTTRSMLNLNTTGGVPYTYASQFGQVTQFKEPGLQNKFEKVNAYTWEGGRGQRCDFWKTMAPRIPI